MDASIIIPTRHRPERVAACLDALGKQAGSCRFEVLLGLDGADPDAERVARIAWEGCRADATLVVVACERIGLNGVRNTLLGRASGRFIISINDDVLPEPGFVEVHVREQRRATEAGRPAVITGYSPWVVHEPDRLFDRVVRESPMVFFYNQMDGHNPDRDWGFRHAWGLNMSVPADALRAVNGWTAFDRLYGYDDIELAWRLGLPVLYRPEAVAPHDHRMEPAGYLEREEKLGWAAWLFAKRNPAFSADLFGRDITTPEELAYSRAYVKRERVDLLRESFMGLAELPASAVDGPYAKTLVHLIYEQHLPLKRWMWRRGLLAASSDA